jgi:hypothetical protein
MLKHATGIAGLALLASAMLAGPACAQMGHVEVLIAKAGLVAGAGAGRGILTYRGRSYPFQVTGLTLGLTIGASLSRLYGPVSYLNHLSDFPGTYHAASAGGALVGGAGGAQLKNDKGVMITLRGPRAGLELSANLTDVRISFRR